MIRSSKSAANMDTQTRTMNQDSDLSPLMTCIKKRDFKAADTLLTHGADVGVLHERLGSALHLACLTPRVPKDLVQKLISPEVINAPNPVDGNTPLHCVVTKYANLKLVPLLLEHNADRNAKNEAGLTPFMTVILEHIKYSDKIVEGRYIGEKHRAFLATLPSLITKENIDCVYGKQRSTPLVMTLDNHNFRCAQMLLDHGADPSICSLTDSALHIACRSGTYYNSGYSITRKMFQSLLVPALVNTTDWQGDTPLHLAIEAGVEECSFHTTHVTMLLESNADIEMTNSKGFTPLMNALRLRRVKLAEQLLKRGADVTVIHHNSGFPLHLASSLPKIPLEMIQSLLIPQAINHVNGHGDTPLHLAVKYNRNLVPMLLKRNADCNLRDSQGRTPLIHALLEYYKTSDFTDMVKLLIAHTNVDTEHGTGMTPLVLAIARRYPLPVDDVILRLCTPRTVCWPRGPPLYAAVKRARWDLVPLLIARGADPNQTWELQGRPPREHVTPLLCTFVDAYNDGLPGERCEPPPLSIYRQLITPKNVDTLYKGNEPPPLSIYRQLITPKNVDTLYKGKCAVQYALENKQWEVIGLLIRCGLLKTGSLKLLSALAVRVKVLPEHPVPVQFKKYLDMDRLLNDYVRKEDSANANNAQRN